MKLPFLPLLWIFAVASPVAAQACEHCDAASPVADAMTVVRDADTGTLRAATPEELAAMRAKAKPAAATAAVEAARAKALAAATSQPAVRAYASGAHSARLPAGLASFSVVRRQADGSLDSRCVQGEQAALEALRASPTPTPAQRAAE